MLKKGLYEQVINEGLAKDLQSDQAVFSETKPIDPEEASDILSKYVSDLIKSSLSKLKDDGISKQVELVNKIVKTVAEDQDDNLVHSNDEKSPEELLSVLPKNNSIYVINDKIRPTRPETPVSRSSLFTGAEKEPSIDTEFSKEIASCDRIDMLVSFIKFSGLRLIREALKEFVHRGGKLRIITTAYMGATEPKALEELLTYPNTEIKVSYDTKITRLHAKAYIFYRDTGFTTAYVGSSNISNPAMTSGLEWNVKVTAKDMPDILEKIKASFTSYWNSDSFETYTQGSETKFREAIEFEKGKKSASSPSDFVMVDIRPFSFLEEVLDDIQAERTIRGNYKNLIVAATGTGKTIISAFDYRRFFQANKEHNRLLFIAHRDEILTQSLGKFRLVLKDRNFGDVWDSRQPRPNQMEHLFASIWTIDSQDLISKVSPDYFDYIVVDEVHHGAAKTYEKILNYFTPKVLLGLTATPERMDRKNILAFFNNKITSEIRLPEAIDRKLLSPFQYFGITDSIDLGEVRWVNGDYDETQLTTLYTQGSEASKRVQLIINSLNEYTADLSLVKGLGFCATQEHAKFMAEAFNANGIPSISLDSNSPSSERDTAKARLQKGEINFIFVVDIYNEGVDIPEINTELFLRPTQSLTIFLQQLGRGLRLSENKECLTVLDYIGQANRQYNFEERYSALLYNSSESVVGEIQNGFPSLPKGCYIQFEKIAQQHVLDNITQAIRQANGLIMRLSSFEDVSKQPLTLSAFLDYYHMDIRTIYAKGTFSRLKVLSRLMPDFKEPLEKEMESAFKRVCSIDSRSWIRFLLDNLPLIQNINLVKLSEKEKRMLMMFFFTMWPDLAYNDSSLQAIKGKLNDLINSPVLFQELLEILEYKLSHIDFIDEKILPNEIPLYLHCSYSRDQILVAFNFLKPNSMRQGVFYLKDQKTDLLFNTLLKAEKDYSPSTMYKDYSINERKFHWQSQSTTSDTSPTGKRYINHQKEGGRVLLFVRERNDDSILHLASPFVLLGIANYESHEGSMPMNIIWDLEKTIPAKFLKTTNKLL